ncbi:hypothetical protein BKA67DRAFT_38874 [Truncatella angustata]|uniref:Secreted protein n=1 Tax=Truncatella angustata TaxID=152316 RepID=A0A9P8UXA3_9PEZI|nr:uncharacterized protein BKA67DRAFT_38874 [Truncatella angustata]KAH6660070.1 hypothetical protein BKA67DRAFT_38874 [Truncatella angustata]
MSVRSWAHTATLSTTLRALLIPTGTFAGTDVVTGFRWNCELQGLRCYNQNGSREAHRTRQIRNGTVWLRLCEQKHNTQRVPTSRNNSLSKLGREYPQVLAAVKSTLKSVNSSDHNQSPPPQNGC